jgi:hypothetical protein
MPIVAADIVYRLSVKTGAAGDATAGTIAGSLGKYVSTTVMTDSAVGNLFDDVSGTENAAGAASTEYRCLFVLNNHATLAWQNVVAYISNQIAGGAAAEIAIDNIAASAKGAAGAQAAEIATEATAPTGVGTFSAPTTQATGLSLGTINAGQVKAIWVKRVPANTAAANSDGLDIQTVGDTAA